MKKLFWTSAMATLLALTFCMTGCGGGGGNPNTNADLTSVKFGADTATLGTPGSTYTGAVPGSIVLLNAEVTVTATPADSKATVESLLLSSGDTYDESAFWNDWSFTFETGDKLVIRVTADDNKTKKYYVIGVTLADVALESLTVGSSPVTLPNPGTTWQTADTGSVLFQFQASAQPPGGLAIVATAVKNDSTIEYARVTGSEEPSFTSSATILFTDGDFLYIKVGAADGESAAYYKIQVNFQQSAEIKYGKVQVGTDEDGFVVDPLWATVTDTYTINKRVTSDPWNPPNNTMTTSGVAKALWDEEGLYVYVIVTDDDVSEVEKAGSQAHEADSVELFINEGYPSTSYSNGGSQYRVGANGGRSGEGDSPDALVKLNKTSAKKTPTGYEIIFQAPWRLRGKFFDSTTYKNGWKFGFELQINAAPVDGQRYGTLVWNNTAHTNYQDARDYGVAELSGAPAVLAFPPLPAVITTQPKNRNANPSTANLSFSVETAAKKDAAIYTYQWYSAATSNGAGTPVVTGGTDATYTFTAPDTLGDTYYYVVITSTLNSKTETTTSARARLTVMTGDIVQPPEDVELVTSDHEKWDTTEQALVVDNGSSFGASNSGATIAELPIPSDIDMKAYLRLEIVADLYVAGNKVTDFSQYNNDLAYNLFKGDGERITQEYNAASGGAFVWSLTPAQKNADYSGGQGKVVVTAMNKSNQVDKVVIKSVKFIVDPNYVPAPPADVTAETLTVALSVGTSTISNQFTGPATAAMSGSDLTLTYAGGLAQVNSAYAEIGFVPIAPEQVAKILNAYTNNGTVTIAVTGSVDTAGASAQFRFGLIDPAEGSGWNGTGLVGPGTISTIFDGTAQSLTWNNPTDKKVGYFGLQLRTDVATVVTISEIKINIVSEPDPDL